MTARVRPTALTSVTDSSTARTASAVPTDTSAPTTGIAMVTTDPKARSRMMMAAAIPMMADQSAPADSACTAGEPE